MAIVINSNLQGDITGIRDADVASVVVINSNFQDIVTGITDTDIAS